MASVTGGAEAPGETIRAQAVARVASRGSSRPGARFGPEPGHPGPAWGRGPSNGTEWEQVLKNQESGTRRGGTRTLPNMKPGGAGGRYGGNRNYPQRA